MFVHAGLLQGQVAD